MDISGELVEAFSSAVPLALREMAEVEVFVRDVHLAGTADVVGDVTAIVRLAIAGGDVSLVMTFPEQTARTLAERVLASVTNVVSKDMVYDCMGEVANVVAGQAKAMLVGSPAHFTLSTPTVHVGEMARPSGERRITEFASNVGDFAIQLCRE